MIPAATAQSSAAAAAAARPQRFVGIFTPHGMAPGYWVPSKEGTDFEYRSVGSRWSLFAIRSP
jgi:hypothetical protein